MLVPTSYALILQESASYTAAAPAGAPAWGDLGIDSEAISSLAFQADAQVENQRQANFLGGPTVRDLHTIIGKRKDLILKCVTLVGDRMGYGGAGALCFVLGATENDNGTTTLTIIRKQA